MEAAAPEPRYTSPDSPPVPPALLLSVSPDTRLICPERPPVWAVVTLVDPDLMDVAPDAPPALPVAVEAPDSTVRVPVTRAPVTEMVARETGCDYFAEDAAAGVNFTKSVYGI